MNCAIFDMDGLLVETEILYVYAFKEVCEIMGDEYDEELFKTCIGTTKKTQEGILKKHFGDDYDFERSNMLTNSVIDRYTDEGNLFLKKGVEEILQMFKSKGFKLAVASSNSSQKVFRALDLTGIKHYFDEILTGDMVTNGKPDPEIFLKACKKLGSTPSKSYVFEDSFNGVRAGFAGGFYTVMVPDLIPPDDEMIQKSNEIIKCLSDFSIK